MADGQERRNTPGNVWVGGNLFVLYLYYRKPHRRLRSACLESVEERFIQDET